jgi:hypothetical protein
MQQTTTADEIWESQTLLDKLRKEKTAANELQKRKHDILVVHNYFSNNKLGLKHGK